MPPPADSDAQPERKPVSWGSLLRTARVPYLLLALLGPALLLAPQMRDMLAALSAPGHLWGASGFVLSTVFFGVTCWYWARSAVSARFDLPDTAEARDAAVRDGGRGLRPRIAAWPLRWVPQMPLPLTGLIGFGLGWRSQAWVLGGLILLLLLIVWWLINHRQAIWNRWRARRGLPPLDGLLLPEDPRLQSTRSLPAWLGRAWFRFAKLLRRAPGGPKLSGGLLAFSLLAFVLTVIASFQPAAASIDVRNWVWTAFTGPTPALLGCALMIAPLTVLTFVFDGWRPTLWPQTAPIGLARPPVLTVLVFISLLMPTVLPTLHAVRPASGKTDPTKRQTLGQQWEAWKSACGADTRPIVVAISGGASRAGLWGAAVLARVEAAARGNNAAIFAISSVSGGSLGAAAYMSFRADDAASGCQLRADDAEKFEQYAKRLGSSDEVGPLLAGYVFSDVPRALFGWIGRWAGSQLVGGDRAAAIERSFEANARDAAGEAKIGIVGLDQPFLSLTKNWLPIWIANGTERNSGTRILTIPVRQSRAGDNDTEGWPFLGATDLLAQAGFDVPISTALNNTARFPFLEPAGYIWNKEQPKPSSVLDGGYYDNSGLESALELVGWLRSKGSRPVLVAVTGDGDGNGNRTRNANEAPPSGLQPGDIVRCGSTGFDPARARVGESEALRASPELHKKAEAKAQFVLEAAAPVLGLYNVRAGHVGVLLRRAAEAMCSRAQAGESDQQAFFHFYLPANGTQNVPLNWVLSEKMAEFIWSSIGDEGEPAKMDRFWAMNACDNSRLKAVLSHPEQQVETVCMDDGLAPVASADQPRG